MWRRIFYILFTVLLVWYFARNWQELLQVGRDIRSGIWYWVFIAAVLQTAHYFFHSYAIKRSFGVLHMERSEREIFLITLGALAINVVAPSMNVSGMAFVVDDARRRGHPGTASLVAAGVSVIVDGSVFICFAIGVAILLLIFGGLSDAFITSLLVLLGLVLCFIFGLMYFYERPHKLEGYLRIIGKERAKRWSDEWIAVTDLHLTARQFLRVVLPEVAAHFCNFASICAIFAAFHQPVFTLVPAIAYTVGVLFVILSPTPMGIGFAESGMTVAMVGQGIPLPVASAITVAYRGLSFWIPFIIGAGILHYLQLQNTEETIPANV